jgi:hypothetical protein
MVGIRRAEFVGITECLASIPCKYLSANSLPGPEQYIFRLVNSKYAGADLHVGRFKAGYPHPMGTFLKFFDFFAQKLRGKVFNNSNWKLNHSIHFATPQKQTPLTSSGNPRAHAMRPYEF